MGGHQRPALAPLPASGERQNWGNRNRRESEPQLALCPQVLLHIPLPGAAVLRPRPILADHPPSGVSRVHALPVRASWAKYLTSTSWSWVSFSRMGLTSLCSVLEGEREGKERDEPSWEVHARQAGGSWARRGPHTQMACEPRDEVNLQAGNRIE